MYAFWPEKRIYEIKYVGLLKKTVLILNYVNH